MESATYMFRCPDCGETWTTQFDPDDPSRFGYPPMMLCRNLKDIGGIKVEQRVNGRLVRVRPGQRKCANACQNSTKDYCECSCAARNHGRNRAWAPVGL